MSQVHGDSVRNVVRQVPDKARQNSQAAEKKFTQLNVQAVSVCLVHETFLLTFHYLILLLVLFSAKTWAMDIGASWA